MFNLARIKDTIKVEPRDLGFEPTDMIMLGINRKYSNRIVSGVGLCTYCWDLQDISEGAVLYGDGCVYYKVIFRIVVFRPFKGECIEAIVKAQWKSVTTHFFNDIWCDQASMPQPTGFDESTKRWFWLADESYQEKMLEPGFDPLESPEEDRFYWDNGEGCKVRVDGDLFNETAIPLSAGGGAARKDQLADSNKVEKDTVDLTNAPYVVHVSMKSQGLGPLSLWPQGEEMEEGEE